MYRGYPLRYFHTFLMANTDQNKLIEDNKDNKHSSSEKNNINLYWYAPKFKR